MTDKEFIDTWNASTTPEEAAVALGRSKGSAITKATRLRQDGHPLKKFPPGTPSSSYLPTPEEIAAETKKIRDGWNKTTTSNNMRSDWKTNGVSFKPIKVAIDGRRLFIKEDY